jgi:predicted flap endonuclease-1-like 5' DNA nuclease
VTTLLFLVALAAGLAVGYALGRSRRGDERPPAAPLAPPQERIAAETEREARSPALDGAIAERARLIRSYEAEAHALRLGLERAGAGRLARDEEGADRRQAALDLAAARADVARYRQLVVDIENNAPPPLMGPGAPDDLKLIVGVGPVLERMLHQLGVTTFRQIAYWSEHDIDVFDAKLHEFPGRIRRDGWVTQARALHQSKYGEALPPRAEAAR